MFGYLLFSKLSAEVKFAVEIGMSPAEAIKAATLQGARLLGIEKEIGSIEVGKVADVISVRGNPLVDLTALDEVRLIMKEGLRLDTLMDGMAFCES